MGGKRSYYEGGGKAWHNWLDAAMLHASCLNNKPLALPVLVPQPDGRFRCLLPCSYVLCRAWQPP